MIQDDQSQLLKEKINLSSLQDIGWQEKDLIVLK